MKLSTFYPATSAQSQIKVADANIPITTAISTSVSGDVITVMGSQTATSDIMVAANTRLVFMPGASLSFSGAAVNGLVLGSNAQVEYAKLVATTLMTSLISINGDDCVISKTALTAPYSVTTAVLLSGARNYVECSTAGLFSTRVSNSGTDNVFDIRGDDSLSFLAHAFASSTSNTVVDSSENNVTPDPSYNTLTNSTPDVTSPFSDRYVKNSSTLAKFYHATAYDVGETFTIDFWFNSIVYGVDFESAITLYSSVNPTNKIQILFFSGNLYFKYNSTIWSGTVFNVTGAWKHFAIVKSDGIAKVYINGIDTGVSNSDATPTGLDTIVLCGDLSSGSPTNICSHRYLTEFRVIKGYAAWMSDFIPPNARS